MVLFHRYQIRLTFSIYAFLSESVVSVRGVDYVLAYAVCL